MQRQREAEVGVLEDTNRADASATANALCGRALNRSAHQSSTNYAPSFLA
jgi:hypothetical protein